MAVVARWMMVGALGLGVQLAVLALLVRLGLPTALATTVAVGLTIVHNFVWHERWTWRHRPSRTARQRAERLAVFLLNLSQRFAARGYSSEEFHLRMTRGEIGSYLGLKLETVSRTLSNFQAQGWITVKNKHLRMLDIDSLRKLVGQYNYRS